MSYGLWLSAAGLQANDYRQALTANNMANSETVGFKRDLAVLRARSVETAANAYQRPFSSDLLDSMSGGIQVRPTCTCFEQGELEETSRPLDAAIAGSGYFTVGDGENVRYTRDGRFTLNASNELVLIAGDGKYKVLDDSGQPITVADPKAGSLEIGKDGTIYQKGAAIAKLGLADFADPTLLRKAGASLFEYRGEEPPIAAKGEVRGGYIERSNVNPIDALTSVIDASRAYELNARMITAQDETTNQAVNRVGRVG